MNRSFVSDINHFLDENGSIPNTLTPEGKNVAEGLTKIISCVTKEPRKSPETDVQCWGKLNRKTCAGEVHAGIDLQKFTILWHCEKYGDGGSISNWENTLWDHGYRP
jgi:hypothetical protein